MSYSELLNRARVGAFMGLYNWMGLRKPLVTQILVTKYCDMECKMCFVYPVDHDEKIRNTIEPSYEAIEKLIDEACDLGTQVIVPFGGEPLIRKDIGKIIDKIKSKGRYCVLYTNGSYVPRRIKEIENADQIVISIDGPPEIHDRIRGKGAYDRAIKAVETAVNHGMVTRIHSVLIQDTMETLQHMVDLSLKYDVMLNYGYCDATELTKAAEGEFVVTRDQVAKFLKEYLRHKEAGVKIASPARVIRECIRLMENWPIENHTISKEENAKYPELKIPECGLRDGNLYIDADGMATPCLPLWGKPDAPNAYRDGVKKAWSHYDNLPCHQCASVFTIEKGLFYSFNIGVALDYISGFEFLGWKKKKPRSLVPVTTKAQDVPEYDADKAEKETAARAKTGV